MEVQAAKQVMPQLCLELCRSEGSVLLENMNRILKLPKLHHYLLNGATAPPADHKLNDTQEKEHSVWWDRWICSCVLTLGLLIRSHRYRAHRFRQQHSCQTAENSSSPSTCWPVCGCAPGYGACWGCTPGGWAAEEEEAMLSGVPDRSSAGALGGPRGERTKCTKQNEEGVWITSPLPCTDFSISSSFP